MSLHRTISLTAVTAVLATAGVAGAAEAPVVSAQQTIHGTAVVTVPGTGVKQGEWMGSKAHLVYRDATLAQDQRAVVTLRAPKGKRIRGLAIRENAKIAVRALDREYAGKTKVTVHAVLRPDAGGQATDRVFALVK